MISDEECPICFEHKPLVQTICKHFFCSECKEKLLNCAICRTQLAILDRPEITVYEYEMPLWSGMIRNMIITDENGETTNVYLTRVASQQQMDPEQERRILQQLNQMYGRTYTNAVIQLLYKLIVFLCFAMIFIMFGATTKTSN